MPCKCRKLSSFRGQVVHVMSFEEAVSGSDKEPHVLLGNGFSLALSRDLFSYGSLFEIADFKNVATSARDVFEVLGTTDFEVVMRALQQAAAVIPTYAPGTTAIADSMVEDALSLREILVQAIAGNHPSRPGDVAAHQYSACRTFLSKFKKIYTLNYDLLLYWAMMQKEVAPDWSADDGFRTPEYGESDYVTWEINQTNRQSIFYMHGALHLFDAGSELQKYTWVNTGVPLIDQIRRALDDEKYPLYVAEGESEDKLIRIKHSDYLSRCFRSFAGIGGTLFVHGHSLADSDDHITRLIGKSRVKQLFVSLFGDPTSDANRGIVAKANRFQSNADGTRVITVNYYDAESANVWGAPSG